MLHPPKFPRIPHLPFSPEIHADDLTHANPEVFLDTEIVIAEKLDGGVAALCDGIVFARSTSQPARHGSFDIIKAQHATRTIGRPELTFYGENMYGIHSIDYERLTDYFYLIAVLVNQTHFLSWSETCAIATEFSFTMVPSLGSFTFSKLDDLRRFLDTNIKSPSVFGGPREGFVPRRTHGFPFTELGTNLAKYVRKGHVQTDEHWSRRWRAAKLAT